MFDLARRYAVYYLNAKTKHGIHSPFVYDLVTRVLEDKTQYPAYTAVEKLRLALLSNKLTTEVEDFGAGGEKQRLYERRVSDIAAKSAKPAKWGKLLYRLCRWFEVKNMLELGTSLGLSGAYQALGAKEKNPDYRFTTIEGSKNIAELARINLKDLGLDEVNVLIGEFDQVLPDFLKQTPPLDWVYIDGNHRYEPTMRYFNAVLPHCHNHTVLVFDDINWSDEMIKAWEEIKANPAIHVTVDLFYIGLAFLRNEQVEEHFTVRF